MLNNTTQKETIMQFKVSSTEEPTQIKGMTVFNTEKVDTKKQPMFFGKPLGIQRYDSYKYPIFDRLTTQQLGYFWAPTSMCVKACWECKLRGPHSRRPRPIWWRCSSNPRRPAIERLIR